MANLVICSERLLLIRCPLLLLGLLQLCIESLRFFLARLFYLLPSLRLDLLDRVNRGLTEPCKINAAILSEPHDRLLWIAVKDFICDLQPFQNCRRRS